jgi:hypothetical protein
LVAVTSSDAYCPQIIVANLQAERDIIRPAGLEKERSKQDKGNHPASDIHVNTLYVHWCGAYEIGFEDATIWLAPLG